MLNHETMHLDSIVEHYSHPVILKVITFLQLFMPITMAKRIICIILLAIGISVEETARISGFCTKTVKSIQKKIVANELNILFVIGGGGRKSSLVEFEADIVDEINQNPYHSKQQIADMIQERYGIKITPQGVGKFLKKTKLNA